MNKKLYGFLLLLLLINTIFSANAICVKPKVEIDISNGGWVECRDGITILHISGSNYDMGFQHGFYLKDEYMICHRAWLSFLEKKNVTLEDMIQIWNVTNSSIPMEYKEEMRGRSDALGLSFEEVAAMEMLGIALYKPKECCGIAAWGPATKDGKLLHIYSGDYSLNLRDPVTGNFALNYQMIVVRKKLTLQLSQ